MIDQLENHYIICGYGRVGRRAAEEMAASGEPFVVLDSTPRRSKWPASAACSASRAAAPTTQPHARRDRARARADRLGRLGPENVYITLSAHSRRPDLTIVARASDGRPSASCLAGADRVVRPYTTAGIEMASSR